MLWKIIKMKKIKYFLIAILGLIVVSAFGGYLYFNEQFTPADNYLNVKGESASIPMTWLSNESNDHVAQLLPVQIDGIDHIFYMQFDFGSPYTMFYKKPFDSILSKFTGVQSVNHTDNSVSLELLLGGLSISSDNFFLINYGNSIDWNNTSRPIIIGTIGTDLLEKRIVEMDFQNDVCSFSKSTDIEGFYPFKFKKRRIHLPAIFNGRKVNLMYDSGTSGYQLVTSKDQWDEFRIHGSAVKKESGNMWGRKLDVFTTEASAELEFSGKKLPLSSITHIEGVPGIQRHLMSISGMDGMLGNKIFLNHKVILDCKNERFRIE